MLTRSSGLPWGRWGSGLLLLGLVVQACSGETKRPIDVHVDTPVGARPGNAGDTGSETGGTGATGGAGGTGGSSGTAATGGSAGSESAGPIVEITSPGAAAGPNDEGVIVEEQIDVLCRVRARKGGGEVDRSTVVIEMLDASDDIIDSAPGAPTMVDDEYAARFVTTDVEGNGRIGFTCRASDDSSPPLSGMDAVDTFVDHGP